MKISYHDLKHRGRLRPKMHNKREAAPFLKWAGGKRWLAKRHLELLPIWEGTYWEPFLGGGAMFFAARPSQAVLSDANKELISCYREIKRKPLEVYAELGRFAKQHSHDFYYQMRNARFEGSIENAARFLYLNRSCFNGIYRVNLKGVFNVPKGSKETILFPSDDFLLTSKELKFANLNTADFEEMIDASEDGDFCFCDPPYTAAHNNNGFIKYNENLFSWTDQIRLRDCLVRAHRRGVKWLCTNASHSSLRELYTGDGIFIREVERSSVIGGARAPRGRYGELLISNYRLMLVE